MCCKCPGEVILWWKVPSNSEDQAVQLAQLTNKQWFKILSTGVQSVDTFLSLHALISGW